MIGLGPYLAFLAVSLLVICTPGQDTALTIRNTLVGGRRGGVATAFGVAAGQATWSAATAAGLAVVLMASAPIFFAIRIAGAAYLVYLGLRALLNLGKESSAPVRTAGAGRWLAQGYLSNLSNAKMVAFFISLLPPFAGPHPSFGLLLLLGLNFSLLTLAWLTGYSIAVERLGGWLRNNRVRRVLDAILGAVLVGLGLRVGAETLAST